MSARIVPDSETFVFDPKASTWRVVEELGKPSYLEIRASGFRGPEARRWPLTDAEGWALRARLDGSLTNAGILAHYSQIRPARKGDTLPP